uniref:GtrA family protein n=1 Tax=candidate division WWE3 bacterium TaxID=2053526 RepID=A0A7C4TS60_UNCKA
MERGNFADSLRAVLRIKYRENPSFFKFLITGCVGVVVDFVFSNLLRFDGMSPGISASLGVLVAMLTTFTLNNNWSFRSKTIKGFNEVSKNLVFYIMTSSVPIVLRFTIVESLIRLVGDNFIVYNSALVISVLIGVAWNYYIYSRLIWGKPKN